MRSTFRRLAEADWDLMLRAQQAGFKMVRLPRFLGCFRIHEEQKTSAMIDVGQEEMQFLRRRHLRPYSNATSNLSHGDAVFCPPILLSLDVPAKDLEILEASSWISTAS